MAERNLPLKHRLLLGAKSQMASVSNKALAETKDVCAKRLACRRIQK